MLIRAKLQMRKRCNLYIDFVSDTCEGILRALEIEMSTSGVSLLLPYSSLSRTWKDWGMVRVEIQYLHGQNLSSWIGVNNIQNLFVAFIMWSILCGTLLSVGNVGTSEFRWWRPIFVYKCPMLWVGRALGDAHLFSSSEFWRVTESQGLERTLGDHLVQPSTGFLDIPVWCLNLVGGI